MCDTLEGFDSTVDAITEAGGDGDAEATVADVNDAIDEFQADLQDVENEGDEVPAAVASALDSAATGLQDALADLADNESLNDAGSAVASAQSAVASAWTDLLNALDCSS